MKSFLPHQKALRKVKRIGLLKDNGESITSMLERRHSSAVEHLIKQFVDNFNLHVSKEKKVAKQITMKQDELLTNSVLLIVLSDEFKTKDGPTCNKKDEYEMPIVTNCDIQEFKKTQTIY